MFVVAASVMVGDVCRIFRWVTPTTLSFSFPFLGSKRNAIIFFFIA